MGMLQRLTGKEMLVDHHIPESIALIHSTSSTEVHY
jgi:hypothetical protein